MMSWVTGGRVGSWRTVGKAILSESEYSNSSMLPLALAVFFAAGVQQKK